MAKSNEDIIKLLQAEFLLDSSFGVNKVVVITRENNREDLSTHRAALISDTASRMYRQAGWKVEDTHDTPTLHWHIKLDNHAMSQESGIKTFVCGVVRNSDTKKRERQVTTEHYHRLRQKDLRDDASDALVSASVNLDLLHVAPAKCVTLDFKSGPLVSRGTSNKGAAFFLYNYARLSTILQKHTDLVTQGLYPPLSELEKVSPLLLNNKAEMELVHCVLEGYASVLSDLESMLRQSKLPQPNIVCRFLANACHVISRYYRNHHVLTEPREHLIPLMHARLHLLTSVQRVLQRVFHLLDIVPVSSMW